MRVAPLGDDLVLVLVDDSTEARASTTYAATSSPTSATSSRRRSAALSLLAEAVLGAADDPEAVERFAGRMQLESARLSSLVPS